MDDFDIENGDLSYEGFLNFAIVTAYSDDVPSSGAVYVLSDVKSEARYIIKGLEKPVNTCFDEESEYLYIVDAKSDDEGVIYQYEIDWEAGEEKDRCIKWKTIDNRRECVKRHYWHEGDRFELDALSYAVVYEGSAATDCAVDAYGNLFFPTLDNHIYGISYIDLY